MPYCAMGREGCKRTLFHAAADIVHHTRLQANAHHDAHMRQPRVQQPGEDVSNFHGLWKTVARRWLIGSPQPRPGPRPICLQVQNPPVIDVRIRLPRSPDLARRICVECLHHVLMHQLLQVQSQPVASRANHHVGADPGGARHIAARVAQLRPCRIVARGHAQLRSCSFSQLLAAGRGRKRVPVRRNPNRGQPTKNTTSLHGKSLAYRISYTVLPCAGNVTLTSFDSLKPPSFHISWARCFFPSRPSCAQLTRSVTGLSSRLKKPKYSA